MFSSHSFWTSSSLDVPAGVTQEEGHTGFIIHLLSAVRALVFLARRIQPFLSLVDREVDFLRTNDLIVLHWAFLFLFFSFLVRKIPFAGIELTSKRVRGLRGTSELPGRPVTSIITDKTSIYRAHRAKKSEHMCEHKHRKKAILRAYFAIWSIRQTKKKALKRNEHYGSRPNIRTTVSDYPLFILWGLGKSKSVVFRICRRRLTCGSRHVFESFVTSPLACNLFTHTHNCTFSAQSRSSVHRL